MSDNVALLYTGDERGFKATRFSHSFLWETADIFVSTWQTKEDINNNRIASYIPSQKIYGWTNFNRELVQQNISDMVESMQHEVDVSKESIKSLMQQYFIVENAYKMMERTGKKYDLVVRLRFDVYLEPDTINVETMINHSKEEDKIFGLYDRFNYGCMASMGFFCKLFSLCSDWYVGERRPFMETLISDHLKQNSISLVNTYDKFLLINSVHSQLGFKEKYFPEAAYSHKQKLELVGEENAN